MRFGLLGTGHWARVVQGAALAAHPDVEFVGVWGRDPAKAADLGGLYSVPAYESIDSLLHDVDAVAIALPPDVQANLAVRAARTGCHLLLDKPIALSVEAADAIVSEVESRGLSSVVFFTQRFQPQTRAALEDAAQTGGWLGGRVTLFGSIYTPGSPYAESVWRQQHGGLWDIGPHALSLLIAALGPVSEVLAMAGPRQTTYVTLRHEGGAVSTMELTLDCAPAAARNETLLHGEHGWLELPGWDGSPQASFERAITELIASREGGTRHPVGVHFGRDVTAILAAAQASSTSKGAVKPSR